MLAPLLIDLGGFELSQVTLCVCAHGGGSGSRSSPEEGQTYLADVPHRAILGVKHGRDVDIALELGGRGADEGGDEAEDEDEEGRELHGGDRREGVVKAKRESRCGRRGNRVLDGRDWKWAGEQLIRSDERGGRRPRWGAPGASGGARRGAGAGQKS